jgi:thiol-disulfide isomerase/thioredoxin
MRRWALLIFVGLLLSPTVSTSAPIDNLHAFKRGSWQELLKAHAGHPMVVHFWGVTCGPCRTEMPQWGEFLQQHPDLPLVMIDADLVPNDVSAVKSMLQQSGLTNVENWMFEDDFVERLRFEIDPHWQGEIPRTLLIGRNGATTTIDGVADLRTVSVWLDDQLKTAK